MGITIRIHQATGGGGGDVDSFNGRVGVVVSQNGDYNTGQVTEVVDKRYVTDAEKALIGNVSGLLTERISNQLVSTQGTTNTNFITYLTLVQNKALVLTDKYLLTVSVSTSMEATNQSVRLQLRDWGVVIGNPYRVENKDDNDRRIETFVFEITPQVVNGWNLELQYASTGGGDPAQIHFALLQLQKINP